MKISAKQKLLMIGDSITDCGRKRPEGEGRGDALGHGYVALVDALLHAAYPQLSIRVVNKGNGGNTVRDLKARWQEDVLAEQPDWLSVMIGINDVWRQHDMPLIKTSHVYIDEYENTLRELVAATRPKLKGLVMMSPYYLEAHRGDAMRAMMDQYGAVVRRIAEEHNAIYIDTQAAFADLLQYNYPATLAWDRVHPNLAGHMALARAFLNAVDFSWEGK